MHQPRNNYLIWSGVAAAVCGLLHIAAIFGGPAWYRFIGATEPIIRMVERGHSYPIMVVLVAATILFACASYAFSGAGLIVRLPLLRTGLVLITAGLLIHGLAFLPMVVLWPETMLGVYDGDGINSVLIVTTILCLVAGVGYALGTRAAWAQLSVKKARLRSV
jgi:hypothetical protein